MKFGIVSLWRASHADFVEEIQTAERHGMDLVGVGDSQAGYRELYVSLALAASNTDRVTLGPMVTNPVTRHPAVTMGAISSIDQLSGGRATIGIGTGGSAVWTLGLPPARIDTLRAYVEALRSLMSTGRASYDGKDFHVDGIERPIPIWVSAEGPRALQLAGAVADGVVLHSGTSDQAVGWCLDQVRTGATSAGRDADGIEVWMMLKASVADTREEALTRVKSGLAGSAEHALRTGAAEKGVPPDLLEPVRELLARYDASQHAQAGGTNADLVDELGLTDFLADLFGLVGTPAECADRLRALEGRGVHGVIATTASQHPIDLVGRLGAEVLPLLRP